MSKRGKSLAILSCAAAPVLYGASALAQNIVTPVPYPDGNPVVLPGFWPSSIQSPSQGPSATGTDPEIASNFFNGVFNNNMNGAPNNGGTGVVTNGNPPSTGAGGISQSDIGFQQAGIIIGQTFSPTANFKLGGISVELNNGGDAGFESNAASIHLYQLNSSINGGSASYTPSTQAVGGDLLGGGLGDDFTPVATSNIEQFVFTGSDQVQLQAGVEYAFEFFVDGPDSNDVLGFNRTNGNDTEPGTQPYTGGQAYEILTGTAGIDPANYYNNAAVPRTTSLGPTARELMFAVYGAPPVTTTGTWTGTAADSNWSTAGNWVNSAVPGTTAGDSALFASPNNANLTQTINLNGNQTLGTLTFNNAGSLYTIAQGSGGTLTMKNSTGTAHIDDLIGLTQSPTGPVGHTISAPIAIANGLQIAVGQATDTLVLSGNISGAGGITLAGDNNALMAGTVVLSGQNTYTGGTTVNSGTLLVQRSSPASATISALPAGALTIGSTSAAAVVILGTNVTLGSQTTSPASPASNVNLTSLSITANSTLDIGNNHIIIDYTAGNDPIASIALLIASGFNVNGTIWTGDGITSSAAAANASSYGIGYADAADAGNPAGLASGQIEVMYTLLGDANLDGKVNGTDFAILASNFNQSVTGWDKGDFNYDNRANGIDFTELAANFNQGASQSADSAALDAFAAANGISLTSVPEPASAVLLLLGSVGAMSRRR